MMNQEEWVEHFEAFNGRKPSPEEYVAALRNGEFTRDSEEAPSSSVSQTSPASKLPEASPVPLQPKQSFLGRLSKPAKIWLAVALVAVIAGGTYAFVQYQHQQHQKHLKRLDEEARNLDGAWEEMGTEIKSIDSDEWKKSKHGSYMTTYYIIKNNLVDMVYTTHIGDDERYHVLKDRMRVNRSQKKLVFWSSNREGYSYEKDGDKLIIYPKGERDIRIHFRKLTADEEKELQRRIEEQENE